MFYCQALVVAPGGVGTLDELFEVLTLRQTGKIQKELPVVLIGREYWETIVNWKVIIVFVCNVVLCMQHFDLSLITNKFAFDMSLLWKLVFINIGTGQIWRFECK